MGGVYIKLKYSGKFFNVSNTYVFSHINPHMGLTNSTVASRQPTSVTPELLIP